MDNKNVIIIHGAFGCPNENWFPFLKREIEALGVNVLVPAFPTPEGQSLESWLEVFKEYENYLNDKTIFVGHSLGPAFILNLLEKYDKVVAAAYFVAPFTGLINIEDFDKINYTITDRNFDWDLIKEHCKEFYVYHSDNDPYVPQSKSEFMSKQLGAKKYEIIEGGGHLGASAGFTEFPALFQEIKSKLETL